jgi:2-isopropylmalate synthase
VLDEVLNRSPNRHAPYVGESAFATKAGIHASAILKEPETYEHVRPESVGNRRRVLVSNQAGKSNLMAELDRVGITVDRDDPRLARLLEEVKAREATGYAYEGADASFELLARRLLGEVPQFFSVDSFRVMVEKRHNARGELVTVSEATVKVFINGGSEPLWSVAEGNGPVNALDNALRKDLGRYRELIKDIELVDYRVRIIPQTQPPGGHGGTGQAGEHDGTDAVTRVLVETHDKANGERWFTIGVSPNIIDASFEALVDSINYKLLRAKAAA